MMRSKSSKLILTLLFIFVALVVLVNIRSIYELVSSTTASLIVSSSNDNFIYLSDLTWDKVDNENSVTNNINDREGNVSLIINGEEKEFSKSIITKGDNNIVYDISSLDYNMFSTYIGVDNSSGDTVKFTVLGSTDGVDYTTLKEVSITTETEELSLQISQYNYLKLSVDDSNDETLDDAVWGEAKLYNINEEKIEPILEKERNINIAISETEYNKEDSTKFTFDISSVEEKDLEYFKSLVTITDEEALVIDNNSAEVEFNLDSDFNWSKQGTYHLNIKVNYADKVFEKNIIITLVSDSLGKISISDFNVEIDDSNLYYTGEEQKPSVIVKDSDNHTLTLDTDYSLEFIDNINAGVALVNIKGIGIYENELEKPFYIQKKVKPDEKDIPFRELTVSSNTSTTNDIKLPVGWLFKENITLAEGVNKLILVYLGDSNNESYELEVTVTREKKITYQAPKTEVPNNTNSTNNSNSSSMPYQLINENLMFYDSNDTEEIEDKDSEYKSDDEKEEYDDEEYTDEDEDYVGKDYKEKEKNLKTVLVIVLILILVFILLYLICKKENPKKRKKSKKRKVNKKSK